MPPPPLSRLSSTAAAAANLFRDLLLRPELTPHTPHLERSLSLILASSRSPLVLPIVDSVLLGCNLSADPALLLRFFVWAGLQSPYRHSSAAFSSASYLLHPPHPLHRLLDAYAHPAAFPASPARAFRILLDLCRHAKLPDESVTVLRRMAELGCRPDTVCYNAALRCIVEAGDVGGVDLALRLLGEMALAGTQPDAVTVVTMVKFLCRAGRFPEARTLVAGMGAHGCVPNPVVLSALVDGACRCGEVEAAAELLEQMERGVPEGCRPNVVTYTCMVKWLCERGRVSEALGVLERMEVRGCRPNRATAITLLNALCREQRIVDAYAIVERAVHRRSLSSEEGYSLLVVGLLANGNLDEGQGLARRMLARGVQLDKMSRNFLIRQLCTRGLFGDAFRWVETLLKEGLEVDSDVYPVISRGLLEDGRLAEAAAVVGWAKERRLALDSSASGNGMALFDIKTGCEPL